jgi:hypothetical protein
MRFEIARLGDAVERLCADLIQATPPTAASGPRADCADEKRPVRHEIHHGERAAFDSYRKMLCANALGRSRTFNLQIKSLLLCQLSYECKITFAKATCRS